MLIGLMLRSPISHLQGSWILTTWLVDLSLYFFLQNGNFLHDFRLRILKLLLPQGLGHFITVKAPGLVLHSFGAFSH